MGYQKSDVFSSFQVQLLRKNILRYSSDCSEKSQRHCSPTQSVTQNPDVRPKQRITSGKVSALKCLLYHSEDVIS